MAEQGQQDTLTLLYRHSAEVIKVGAGAGAGGRADRQERDWLHPYLLVSWRELGHHSSVVTTVQAQATILLLEVR